MKQKNSGNCLSLCKQGGGVCQLSTFVCTEGEGVKNRQNPVYIVCVRLIEE